MMTKHSITLTSAPVAAALTERDPQARELVVGNAPQLDAASLTLYGTTLKTFGFDAMYAVRHLIGGEK